MRKSITRTPVIGLYLVDAAKNLGGGVKRSSISEAVRVDKICSGGVIAKVI